MINRMTIQSICLATIPAFLVSFSPPSAVLAHSDPVKSDPAPATEVEEAPREVYIYLDEAVDSAYSSLVVVDEAGIQVDRGDGRVDPAAGEGNRLVVSLPPALKPGVYTVRWRVLSRVDGHTTRGEYQFAVAGRSSLDGGAEETLKEAGLWLAAGLFALGLLVLAALLVFKLKDSGSSEG